MKLNLAGKSLLLFGLSVVFLIALTLFEPALAGVSLGVERLITFMVLVLPSGAGAVFGVMSLFRKEGRALIAVLAILLNILFALFHLTVLLFAG